MDRLFQKSSRAESDVVSRQVVTAGRRRDGAHANKSGGLSIAEPGSRALADRNRSSSAQLREFPEHPAQDWEKLATLGCPWTTGTVAHVDTAQVYGSAAG